MVLLLTIILYRNKFQLELTLNYVNYYVYRKQQLITEFGIKLHELPGCNEMPKRILFHMLISR